MAGPGGTEVGRVSVKVVPDVEQFREKVKKELQEVEKMSADVSIELDLTKFKAQIEEVKLLLKSISDETVNINANKNGVSGITSLSSELKKSSTEAKKLAQNMKQALGDGQDHKISRITSAMQGFAGVIEKTGSALIELGSKGLSQVGEGFKGVAGSIAGMVVQIAIWVPLIAGLIGLVTFLVGFLAAALLTLPALLAAIAAPIAAVVLGFEGIKKAAQTLKPELDALKKRLSDTFAKELKPLFQSIKQIFPTISDGLNKVAVGVSRFITELSKVFTSAEGVQLLAKAFENVNLFLDNLLPGVKSLLDTFLKVAAVPEIFQEVGGAISDVFKQFQGFIQSSIDDGTLVSSVKNFRLILNDLADLFTDLLRNALKFFNGATPGMDKFFRALSEFFSRIDWEKLGKAFGDIFGALGDAISQIPPETIQQITDSFVKLAEAVGKLFSGKSFDVIIALFTFIIDTATFVIEAIDLIAEGFANFGDALANLPDKALEFTSWLQSLPSKIATWLGEVGPVLFAKGREFLQGLWDGMIEKAEEIWAWIRQIPQRIFDFLGDAGGTLWARGREFLQGLWDGMENKAFEVWAWIQDIPNKIAGFFAGAGRWLFDAGVKIIQGLIDGIKSMMGALFGQLGVATKGIPEHKGPPSKDKMLLFKNGQLIMQGLMNGLSAGYAPVTRLLDSMTEDITGVFSNPQVLSSMSVSGADITAVGSSQLQIAGQVESNTLENQIVKALSEWTIDGKGLTRKVNNTNTAQRRRG